MGGILGGGVGVIERKYFKKVKMVIVFNVVFFNRGFKLIFIYLNIEVFGSFFYCWV